MIIKNVMSMMSHSSQLSLQRHAFTKGEWALNTFVEDASLITDQVSQTERQSDTNMYDEYWMSVFILQLQVAIEAVSN